MTFTTFWFLTAHRRLAWSRRMFNRVNAVETNAIPLDKLVSFVYRLWFESLASVEGMWPCTHRALSRFLVIFNCIYIFSLIHGSFRHQGGDFGAGVLEFGVFTWDTGFEKNGWLATSARSLRKLTTALKVGITRPWRSRFFRCSRNFVWAHFGSLRIIFSRLSVFISTKQSIDSRVSYITCTVSA